MSENSSEKLYALLLRLYPARFRRQYGEEAMRVFRERLRDERGTLARLRLWFDLLADTGLSLPREYRRAASPLSTVRASAPAGMPLFQSLENELPKPASIFGGAILAFLAVAGLGFLLNHAGKVRVWAVQYAAPQAQTSAQPASGALTGPGPGGAGSASATSGQTSAGPASTPQSSRGQAPAPPPPPPQSGPAPRLDDAARRRILAAVAATLRQSYPDHHSAERIAFSLSASENRGDYQTLPDAAAFADTVTQQMRAVSNDSGLVLYFVATPLPKTAPAGDIYWIDPHFLLRVPLPPTNH